MLINYIIYIIKIGEIYEKNNYYYQFIRNCKTDLSKYTDKLNSIVEERNILKIPMWNDRDAIKKTSDDELNEKRKEKRRKVIKKKNGSRDPIFYE